MAIKALTPGKLIEHVYSGDVRPAFIEPTDAEPSPDNSAHDDWAPTKFFLKCLDSRILGILKDKSTKITIDPKNPNDEVGTQVNQNAYYFDVVSLAFDSADNFDSVAKPGRMKRNIGGVSYTITVPEFIGTIPELVLAELAERVIEGNSLSADEGNA